MNGQEVRTIKLPWHEIDTIFTEMACEILGVRVSCKAVPKEEGLWWIAFQNYRMPLPELCRLVQTLHPTVEDWEDALPDEGEPDVGSIGMFIAEKLLGKHLGLVWEHSLMTEDGLLLVDVKDSNSPLPETNAGACKLTSDLARAITVIASHLYGNEQGDETEGSNEYES